MLPNTLPNLRPWLVAATLLILLPSAGSGQVVEEETPRKPAHQAFVLPNAVLLQPVHAWLSASAVKAHRRIAPSASPMAAAAAIEEVMAFRRGWLTDVTPFHACPIYQVLGEPADFPSSLEPAAVELLHATENPCAQENTPFLGPGRQLVILQSLTLVGPQPSAELLVLKGQNSYTEEHFFIPDRSTWRVREVRTFGRMTVHPPSATAREFLKDHH